MALDDPVDISPLLNCAPILSVSPSPVFKVAKHLSTSHKLIQNVVQHSYPNFLFPLGFKEEDFVSFHCFGIEGDNEFKDCLKKPAKVVLCWKNKPYQAYAICYAIKPSYKSGCRGYRISVITQDKCDGSRRTSTYNIKGAC